MQIYIDTSGIKDKTLAAQLLQTSFAGTPLAGTPETDDDYATGILVTGGLFSADPDFLPDSDECATDGVAVCQKYSIEGADVFLLKSEYESAIFLSDPGTSIKQIVGGFEAGDASLPEHLAMWGFDGTPEEAEDGANLRVWVEPSYYVGTIGAPIGHYARQDNQREPLVFPTKAEAQKWVDGQESAYYMLGSGEAGRPVFTICK